MKTVGFQSSPVALPWTKPCRESKKVLSFFSSSIVMLCSVLRGLPAVLVKCLGGVTRPVMYSDPTRADARMAGFLISVLRLVLRKVPASSPTTFGGIEPPALQVGPTAGVLWTPCYVGIRFTYVHSVLWLGMRTLGGN